MSEHDFYSEVLTSLSEFKAEQAGMRAEVQAIVARLDKLNGSVSRHEQSIGQLLIDQARRQGQESTSRRWMERVWPIIYVCVGVAVVFLLQHAPSVLAAVRH